MLRIISSFLQISFVIISSPLFIIFYVNAIYFFKIIFAVVLKKTFINFRCCFICFFFILVFYRLLIRFVFSFSFFVGSFIFSILIFYIFISRIYNTFYSSRINKLTNLNSLFRCCRFTDYVFIKIIYRLLLVFSMR